MTPAWPRVALGDLLTPIWRDEIVDPSKEYRLLGARWYAGGLFLKDVKSGQEIRANRLYRVEAGDFVYNRLFAWKGSFALASDEDDGCCVSNEFPCFEIDHTRLDGNFLWSYFRRENTWTEALGLSSGATPTSRNRLKESLFLKMAMPLPPLPEQQRIAARIDAVAKQISQGKVLRNAAITERASLWIAALEKAFARLGSYSTPIASVLTRVKREIILQPGVHYLPTGITNHAKGLIQYAAISSKDTKYASLFAVENGDLIYSKLKVWEGSLAIVPPEYTGRVVSSEFPTFTVDYSAVDRNYLDQWLRRPSLWAWLGDQVRGIGGRKIRVDVETFLRSPFQLPPLQVQREVVQALGPLRDADVCLERLQHETMIELNALLPAILDRAYRGEL